MYLETGLPRTADHQTQKLEPRSYEQPLKPPLTEVLIVTCGSFRARLKGFLQPEVPLPFFNCHLVACW
jgi:hypothetical protein